MKPRRALGLLVAFAIVVFGAACRRPPAVTPPSTPALIATTETAEDQGSLYDLPMALTDQAGQPTTLDRYRGELVLVSMFYTTCAAACPMLISRIDRVEQALPHEVRDRVRVLLVSFDPARDDVAALERTFRARQLDASRWTMARVAEPDVRTLAAVLGIKYRGLVDGSFNHSSVIAMLDEQGHIAGRIDGLGQAQDEWIAVLTKRAAVIGSKP